MSQIRCCSAREVLAESTLPECAVLCLSGVPPSKISLRLPPYQACPAAPGHAHRFPCVDAQIAALLYAFLQVLRGCADLIPLHLFRIKYQLPRGLQRTCSFPLPTTLLSLMISLRRAAVNHKPDLDPYRGLRAERAAGSKSVKRKEPRTLSLSAGSTQRSIRATASPSLVKIRRLIVVYECGRMFVGALSGCDRSQLARGGPSAIAWRCFCFCPR